MAKFRKDDLKLIVKELVRESLLEILAEEYIEEATFRAVESASGQIVGTVTKQINKQLRPIMEQIQGSAIKAQPSMSKVYPKEDEYIQTLDEDYGNISVTESLGLSDLGDPDSMDSIIANVRAQMQQERGESKDETSITAQLGISGDDDELPGPTPAKTLEGLGGQFEHLIKSSATTLREQNASSRHSVGPDMFNISNTKGTVAVADQKSDPLFFKKIVDKVNSRTSSSPILGGQMAAAQQAHAQAQMLKVDKSDLDRPAHEVIKQSR